MEQQELERSWVRVHRGQMHQFTKRLASLNAKARAFGLPDIEVLEQREVIFERRVEFVGRSDNTLFVLTTPEPGAQLKDPVPITEIKLAYPTIKLGRWRVLVQLEAAEAGTLAFAVTQDEAERTVLRSRVPDASHCDHCGTRRRRRFTYLLRCTETRAFKLVGKACLADFTGIDPAAALFLAKVYDLVRSTAEDFEGEVQAGVRRSVGTEAYLARVSFLIATEGFTSVSGARSTGRTPTYLDAMRFEDVLKDRGADMSRAWRADQERHVARARAVRAHFSPANSAGPADDFSRNVQVLLAADCLNLDTRHLAFAAAAVARVGREDRAAPAKPSSHVGVQGEKLTTGVKLRRVIPIEGPYGLTHLVLMDDTEGNRLVWKTAACPRVFMECDGNAIHQIKASVKKHEEYRGASQTVLTRVAILPAVPPAPAAATPA